MSVEDERDGAQRERDQAAIARLVAEAPRLTAVQRKRLAQIIHGGPAAR